MRMKTLGMLLVNVVLMVAVVTAQEPTTSVKELRQEKVVLLKQLVDVVQRAFQQGETSFDALAAAQLSYLNAGLDVTETSEQRLSLLREAMATARRNVESVELLVRSGAASTQDLIKAKAVLLDRRIALVLEEDTK